MKSTLEAVRNLGKALAQADCKGPFTLHLPLHAFKALATEVEEKCNPPPFSSMEEERQQNELRERAMRGEGMSTLQIWTEAGNAIICPIGVR